MEYSYSKRALSLLTSIKSHSYQYENEFKTKITSDNKIMKYYIDCIFSSNAGLPLYYKYKQLGYLEYNCFDLMKILDKSFKKPTINSNSEIKRNESQHEKEKKLSANRHALFLIILVMIKNWFRNSKPIFLVEQRFNSTIQIIESMILETIPLIKGYDLESVQIMCKFALSEINC